MKTIIIGDIHGRGIWEDIIEESKPDKIIFLGDYWDSFYETFITQKVNFMQICNLKQQDPDNVTLLLGNHDFYLRGFMGGWSGFQTNHYQEITQMMEDNLHLFEMCTRMGPYLVSHAGVSSVWLDDHFDGWTVAAIPDLLNKAIKDDIYVYKFTGNDMYGDDPHESPVWIRPRSVISANMETELDNITQIVGHTASAFSSCQTIEGQREMYRNLLILDALYHGVYGVYENEELTFQKLESYVKT